MQPPSDTLEQVEELLRSGYKADARSLLTGFLKENPDSAKGWWLMSFAVSDPDQQFECLERVLAIHPNHRKALARMASLVGQSQPLGVALKEKLSGFSLPVNALILVSGCLGLMVIGYLTFRIFSSGQRTLTTQTEIAQDLLPSATMITNSALSISTPTPSPMLEQTPSPAATYTPLVSITPTTNPHASLTPIPENLIGNSVGQFPPVFTLINAVTNAEVNLREFTGKPILLVFLNTLATECEPEMPGLQSAYEKYQDQGVVVLGIGVGSSQSALRNYTGRFGGLSFPLLSDWEHTIADAFDVDTLPTNVFIRKNGKIWQVSAVALTESEINTVITSLLKVP